ncbi:MAG: ABC transporter permease [Planctomycetaceae bacterium]|nr:ABC transporter permease [Planctomycetales bacterium]MCB9874021.1 ABC transporter permease [Planctomycetaceae bacterium]MCB9941209.1 ABC transporter permease [Planctomycetaceae bacterium]
MQKFVSQYGVVFVLVLLCAYYSFATLNPQQPSDAATGRNLAEFISKQHPTASVLIVVRDSDDDRAYAASIQQTLEAANIKPLDVVAGEPRDIVGELRRLGTAGTKLDIIATQHASAQWAVLGETKLKELAAEFPSLSNVQVLKPSSYTWPTFLTRGNLLSIGNQVAVTAIIAIAMTMVIITAGIDLSVGSLMALSGVLAAWTIHRMAGDGDPGMMTLAFACSAAVLLSALIGLLTGVMVTAFDIPAFIVTLAVMRIARGMAYKVADGPSPIGIESEAFHSLSAGTMFGIPNPVILMVVLYVFSYILMSHTALGRYIYAVGGNPEAARLSGVPVKRVLLFVYAICGALAGLGGVMEASLFSVGNPNSGVGYELQIIAAVVVGGTSLMGGKGKVLGTLIGALILAVISNGMYLTKVDSYTQMIVFGTLILIAVLLDQLKSKRWKF